MTYFNFTKITPPAPSDPLVSVTNHINNNWDHLETQLTPYVNGATPTGMETGQEYFDSNGRFAVFDGASGRVPDDIDAAWSAWTNIPMLSPRVIRSGQQPKWRNNSLLRMVQVRGGVLFNSIQDPWTSLTLVTVNGDVSGAIPASMVPVGGQHVYSAVAAIATSPAITSGAYIVVDKPGGNTFVRIRAQYMGGPGGGNYIQLDHGWWWY